MPPVAAPHAMPVVKQRSLPATARLRSAFFNELTTPAARCNRDMTDSPPSGKIAAAWTHRTYEISASSRTLTMARARLPIAFSSVRARLLIVT